MKKKIFLIWPGKKVNRRIEKIFPLWAISLSTYLKENGFDDEIHIFDGQICTKEAIIKKIKEVRPDIVGMSTSYIYHKDTLRFAREAKLINAQVVLGGAYASSAKQEILINRGRYSNDYCVDVVIQKDGEEAFFKYIKGESVEKINNLVYQDKKGKIVENKISNLDINDLPVNDFNLIDLNKYKYFLGRKKVRVVGYVYFSKGCSWREKSGGCIFCSSIEKGLRYKDPEKAVEEVFSLFKNHSFRFFKILSEDVLFDFDWFRKFSKLYKSRLKGKFPFLGVSTRVDKITKETVKMMQEANVGRIALGFETGSKQGLIDIRKGITLNDSRKAIKLLKDSGITITGHFILGIPKENSRTLNETYSLIEGLASLGNTKYIRCQQFIPLPSSSSWSILLKKTGHKYKNRDIIDWKEVKKDWLAGFCDLNKKDLVEFSDRLDKLSKEKSNLNIKMLF